jgi:hypothetical protein
MKLNRLFLSVLVLLLLTACGLFGGGSRKVVKDSHYRIRFSTPGWNKVEPQGTDIAYSDGKGRFLFANSFCHEFQHLSLDKLAYKSLQSLDKFSVTESSLGQFQGRESYLLKGVGKIDGVATEIVLRNYRRDHCYYDFFLVTPKMTEALNEVFKEFVNSIEFK